MQHSITRPQHEKEIEVVLFVRQQRFKCCDRLGELIPHEVANAFEVTRLNALRVGSKNIPKVGARMLEFLFAKVCESKVQANTGHTWRKRFGFEKRLDGFVESTGSHVHYAEIGIHGS